MTPLYRKLKELLTAINGVDKVVSVERENELDGNKHDLACSLEPLKDGDYKTLKGKHDTSMFVNCYCTNMKDIDAIQYSQALRGKIIELLDEVDYSDSKIKIYKSKLDSHSPVCDYNDNISMWYCTAKFMIRWSEIK